MDQNEEYIEINLKDIMFYVLRRWKPVIAVAVVLAVLLGGFQAVNEYRTITKAEEEDEYWIEYQKYQDQLALYESQVSLTQDKIDTLQEYIDHAVMMKADYRDVYIAKATYYIDSDYKIMPELNYQNPDKTYTLTWYYQNFLQDYSIYETISEEVSIEAKYLMDLVSISTANNDTLHMTVTHPNQRYAIRIMDALKTQLDNVHAHLDETVREHTLTPMLDTCGSYVDENLKDKQQAVYDDMLKYQGELIKQEETLREFEEEGEPAEPNVLKSFIKWFILGGVAGGAVMVVILAAKALFAGRVYFPDDLVSRYRIPVLGSIVAGSRKYDPITQWIRKLEGRQLENTEETRKFLAANFRNRCEGWQNILVCSDIASEESDVVAAVLAEQVPEVRFQPAGSLTKDPLALSSLPQCDAVILAVTADASRNKDITKAMKMIQDCGKTTLGFVFLEK